MGSKVKYSSLRSADSYIDEASLNHPTSEDSRPPGDIDVDSEAVTQDSLDPDEGSNTVDCLDESYRESIHLHNVGAEEDQSNFESTRSLRSSRYTLTLKDVSPIETARARFLRIIVDHFLREHLIGKIDAEAESTAPGEDNFNKRKSMELQYEGDPRFVLPLMYVANMYETLVNEVNVRLASLSGFREKRIGVALEAAGGLYRKLAKKFPRKGPCTFRRRELATSLETRTRFPELVVQEEKRVRFVVINGLDIVEKPDDVPVNDAEWFKRLTGRDEVSISTRDYKFYSPRHKYRRPTLYPLSNIPGLASYPGSSDHDFQSVTENHTQQESSSKHIEPLSPQPQFQTFHLSRHQLLNQNPQATHFVHGHHCVQSSHLSDITHTPDLPTVAGCHVLGRLQTMSSGPAKFCDECGSPYLRETSKFCSQCGTKRFGI